ncbi:MAG: hypothetical protein WBB37_00600 [bacterium]
MIQIEILLGIIDLFEEYNIEYMITGSFASNLHGFPRATFDADVVIKAEVESLEQLTNEISKDFYVEKAFDEEILDKQGMFNIIHYETGFKIDIIFIKRRGFSRTEFDRRQLINFAGCRCWFSSPEDTILSKLEWAKLGGSERQFNDALGVAKVQSEKLDWTYIRKWAKELNVIELLDKILRIL